MSAHSNRTPPEAESPEAKPHQLELAKQQGDAVGKAVREMADNEAHDAKMTTAGDFRVGYAVEKAEGHYRRTDGQLQWQSPEGNVHLEVVVLDGGDGRFVPGLDVTATLVDSEGNEIGTHRQPFYWHPWLYHYGRNWDVPGDGEYTLRVHVDAPEFARHDIKNGKRYADPVDVEFEHVKVETGRKKSREKVEP